MGVFLLCENSKFSLISERKEGEQNYGLPPFIGEIDLERDDYYHRDVFELRYDDLFQYIV